MSDVVIIAGTITTLLFGLSVMSGRVTLAMIRGGRADQEAGFRHWSGVLMLPAQIALIAWLFVFLYWYLALGAILLGLFFFGAAVNRGNLATFYAAQPVLNGIAIVGTIMIWISSTGI